MERLLYVEDEVLYQVEEFKYLRLEADGQISMVSTGNQALFWCVVVYIPSLTYGHKTAVSVLYKVAGLS